MSKALSNGTLSLRFMQNAHRAKQQAQIEAEQAKVKDAAEWEVSPEVKDAWGIGISPGTILSTSSNQITHESSYLPFVFASPSGGNSSPNVEDAEEPKHMKFKGRRTFNEDGQEVIPQPANLDVVPNEGEITAISKSERSELSRTKSSPTKRPTSISGFQAPLITKQKDSKRTKTAQMIIREDMTGVRKSPSSLRTQPFSSSSSTPAATSAGFLKPPGVDVPAPSRDVHLAESTKKFKRSRDRESTVTQNPSGLEGKRRRKGVEFAP